MNVLLISEGINELGGALETLDRRIVPSVENCDAKSIRDPELKVHPGKGPGYFKKALRCVLFAAEEGYDACILVIDQDDDRSRVQQLSNAQDDMTVTLLPRALGVAIQMFDAWMLADEAALSAVFDVPIQRQPDPESIDDPKHTCNQFCDASEEHSRTTAYSAIAAALSLDLLEERCPDGFGTFARRLRAL